MELLGKIPGNPGTYVKTSSLAFSEFKVQLLMQKTHQGGIISISKV